MGNLEARIKIKAESRARVRTLSFGEPVTNICASESNPWFHSYFVRVKGDLVQLTNRRGKFNDFGCEVIHPGHLPIAAAKDLFNPVWQAEYGTADQSKASDS